MSEIPSIGRIVTYRDAGEPAEDMAAIITRVNDDGTADLTVFLPDEEPQPIARVKLDQSPSPGTWRWPVRVS